MAPSAGAANVTIPSGTKLGRYEIRSQLGAGGMGEVYRARDEKLNRDVAIKVLPATYSQNAERLRRFEQEAQAAGALNHPNILAVYDVGSHDDEPYVVSELLEGESLKDRLNDGPIAQRKAIDYAVQVVHGLAAAHEKGIVHRDLKPDNLFITKDDRVKILDFGLAKLIEPVSEGVAQTDIATRKVQTDPGTVMGTVGYMSPEQVRGRAVDHRSDIFSFGAVTYEMLSGKRAFHGDSAVETLNAILKEDPPELTKTNPNIAPAVERVIWHCLEKSPERRFQSARDVAFALENASTPSSGSTQTAILSAPLRVKTRERPIWIAAVALLLIIVIGLAAIGLRRTPADVNAVRFPIVIPEGSIPYADVETHNMSVSPDGRYLAFIAFSAGQRVLWVRPLGALTAQALPGTEGAYSVFWSPDSRDLAYFADGKLMQIEVSGKSLQTVCNLPVAGDASGAWGSEGTIVFSEDGNGNIYRVPATGGTPSLLVENKSRSARRWIHFLPDGRRFLFYKYNEHLDNDGIYAGSTDSLEIRQVAPMPPTRAQYVQGGYLLYPRDGSLVARPFDEKNLRFTGEPIVVVERLPYFDKTGWADFSASENGVLAYMTEFPKTRLVWLDRAGRGTGQIGAPGDYAELRLSPDGQKAALRISDPRTLSGDLWIQDLVRDTRTRFVSGAADDSGPVWSPDGRRLAYFSCCEDDSTLHIKDSGDTGKGQLLIKDQRFISPQDWSQDGRFIIYQKDQSELWVLPLSGDGKPYTFIQTQSSDPSVRFSPDGRWVAFVSEETGRQEVYVTRFDKPGEKWRISTDGGNLPRWRRDGRELFYLTPDGKVMTVQTKPGTEFGAGSPMPLFKADPLSRDYDVTADGQRFLFIASAPGTQLLPFAVVLDWTADLKK
jgi:Tol biopolymer transport system component/tRNA A-37 threonylcarbamoyl transferase component Bud32